jgi:inorganic pyrophosphatase/exopolyphosphatase
MTKKQIVVGGKAYADIDVLACIAAYTQLLTLKGFQAEGIITGPLNQTISHSIKKWPTKIAQSFSVPNEPCSFILVDISDPNFIEQFVEIEKVIEVYDHHYGHEKFWKERLPNTAFIEHVGACATLIWERFKESGLQNLITSTNANLLYTAIFANTLDFKAYVTTDRDRNASEELLKYTDLPNNWKAIYYAEIAEEFNKDLSEHIHKDTKTISLNDIPMYFGQIEIWNAAPIVEIFDRKFTPKPNEEWLINIASIEEGCSYFYTNSDRLQKKTMQITSAKETARNLLKCQRLWLRKEILREFLKLKSE